MSAIKKIVAPTDFSEGSKEALRYACALADALRAIIRVTGKPYVLGGFFDHYAPPDFQSEVPLPGRRGASASARA